MLVYGQRTANHDDRIRKRQDPFGTIKNRVYLDVPLVNTPTRSKLIATDEFGFFVKEWIVPVGKSNIRLDISDFGKGIYTIHRLTAKNGELEVEKQDFYKNSDPEYPNYFNIYYKLTGRYHISINAAALLGECRYKYYEQKNATPFHFNIDGSSAKGVISKLNKSIKGFAYAAVASLALLLVLPPTKCLAGEGGEKNKEGIVSPITAPTCRPMAPADTSDLTDEYEWRTLKEIIDTSGVMMSQENNFWAYKKNGSPVINTAGEDTSYTFSIGDTTYFCGTFIDSVRGGSDWYSVEYRYLQGETMADLTTKWEGISPLNSLGFWAWDSTTTRWIETIWCYGPPAPIFARFVKYSEVTDDSVYSNASTAVYGYHWGKSYRVFHTRHTISIPRNNLAIVLNRGGFNLVAENRGDTLVNPDTTLISIRNAGLYNIDLGISCDSIPYFQMVDSLCYGCWSLYGIFKDTTGSPSPAEFFSADKIAYSLKYATTDTFGIEGVNIPYDSTATLWFKYISPVAFPLDTFTINIHINARQHLP